MKPKGGVFETPVSLKACDISTFWVYARDGQGRLLDTDPSEFKVRHGLVPSAPPLPHTLSVEILNPGGNSVLDPVFSKGTPLPAEKTIKYRATRSLIPDDSGSDLAIKLWEGEFLDDPDANEWVGHVLLSHNDVRRSVPAGTEIEVTIQVNASRLITVDAFVPYLNQPFTDKLYMPQREEQDFSELSNSIASETQKYRQRLEEIDRTCSNGDHDSMQSEVEDLRRDLDELDARAPSHNSTAGKVDPDDARRIVEEFKSVRGRLVRLERQAVGRSSPRHTEFEELVDKVAEVVGQFGTSLEKQQLAMLRQELERVAAKGNDKAIQRVCGEIDGLRLRVLFKHDWFWRDIFDSLQEPNTPFVDLAAARGHMAIGQVAVSSGDGEGLRKVVRALWKLQPKGNAEATRESAVCSGLRKF
jgi:molecular chaperone DnaK